MEINSDSDIRAVAFSGNGEYIVGGDVRYLASVGVWRMKDGKQVAMMTSPHKDAVICVAVLKDSRWIAAGTFSGIAVVWDAETCEEILTHIHEGNAVVALDFSPDSTRLVTASECYSTIWDVATRERVLTLNHESWVMAAKYSPQGDRIATATRQSVRVWNSSDARLLVDIPVKVEPSFNTGLLWLNDHLFVVSKNKIMEFEASTGSAVSEWPVPDTSNTACVALPKHGEFIAYSTNDTVTFWDISTHTQLGLIQHPQGISSLALLPDDRFLAFAANGKVAFKDLRDVPLASYSTVSIVYYRIMFYTFYSFGSTYRLITLSLSYHSFTSPMLHSIPGSRTGSQTRKLH